MALARLLLVAMLLGGVTGACGAAPTSGDRVDARLGDAAWELLIAPPDGMRGRTDFDGADGMLFDQGREVSPGAIRFVMDGVSIPLAIAWFDADGGIVGLTRMEPCESRPCPTYGPEQAFRYAIEAPVGAFDGLTQGDRLEILD